MNISENLGFAPVNRQPLDRNDRHRVGSWRLAVGGWRLAVSSWRLAVGGWQLAVCAGGWPFLILGLVVGGFAFAVRGELMLLAWPRQSTRKRQTANC